MAGGSSAAGWLTCQELAARGVKIIGVGDRYGAIHNPRGLDMAALMKHTATGGSVRDFPGGEVIPFEAATA